ncbi:hypothetical protein SNEBB_002549 [Seison nebaliae]|nr:hypothetical protein SNEBB_002549 [Seison nebaliae]
MNDRRIKKCDICSSDFKFRESDELLIPIDTWFSEDARIVCDECFNKHLKNTENNFMNLNEFYRVHPFHEIIFTADSCKTYLRWQRELKEIFTNQDRVWKRKFKENKSNKQSNLQEFHIIETSNLKQADPYSYSVGGWSNDRHIVTSTPVMKLSSSKERRKI